MAIFLIVFLLYMMLSNKSSGGLKQILSDIDLETVKPLLSLFGIDESALDALNNENFGNPTAGHGAGNYGEYSGGNNNQGFGNIGGGFDNGYTDGGYSAEPPANGGLNPVKDLLSPDNLSDLEECFSI